MFVACMALGATAQTTMDTAGELKEGMNSFEYTEARLLQPTGSTQRQPLRC